MAIGRAPVLIGLTGLTPSAAVFYRAKQKENIQQHSEKLYQKSSLRENLTGTLTLTS